MTAKGVTVKSGFSIIKVYCFFISACSMKDCMSGGFPLSGLVLSVFTSDKC
uniref:Uncharacterized protein n=1 Tax=Lepeophtheirus salmonis TaxID=72036 RepID=A0A0K2VFM4_LEPSM